MPSTSHGVNAEDRRHASLLEKQRAVALDCSELQASTTQQLQSLIFNGAPSTRTSRKLRVAVDVDEVLGRFLFALNKFCKDHYDMEYCVGDYWVYEFAKIWNCTTDESNHIVHEFFKSQHFNDGIPVIPGAFDSLLRLKSHCELVVVTSRQHAIRDATLEWIDNHFPGIFEDVYFGNHFALQGTSRKKSEICKSIGAQVLIDDNPAYAQECAEEGLQVLLYDWDGDYPWSKLPKQVTSPNILVVRNWSEVESGLLSLMRQQAST